MLLLAAVISLALLALGVLALVAHLVGRRLPWDVAVFRALIVATVPSWAGMVVWLWDLPAFAARQGAGTGAAWLAHSAAAAGAALLGALLYITAWRLVPRAPMVAGIIPAIAAIAALLARHLSSYGAPAELYLADDGKLWIVYALLSLTAAAGLVLYGTHAPRAAERDDTVRIAR